MTVAIGANLQTAAATSITDASQALIAALARAAIVQALIERGDLAAERLRLLPVELAIFDGSLWTVFRVALRQFINPGEFARVCRKVAKSRNGRLKVAFFLRDVPVTVVRANDFHRLLLGYAPAQVVINGTIECRVITLEDWA